MTFRKEIEAIFKRHDDERRELKRVTAAALLSGEEPVAPGLVMLRQTDGSNCGVVMERETPDGPRFLTFAIGTRTSDSDLERVAEKLSALAALDDPNNASALQRRNVKVLEEFRRLKNAYAQPLPWSAHDDVSPSQSAALAKALGPYPGFSPLLFGDWALWRVNRVANDSVDAEIRRHSMPSPSAERERLEPFLNALSTVRKGLETNVLFPMNNDRVLLDASEARRKTINPHQVPFTMKDDTWSDVVEVGQFVMVYLSMRARQVQKELKANLLVAGRPTTPYLRDLRNEIVVRLQSAAKKRVKKIAENTASEVLEILGASELIKARLDELKTRRAASVADPTGKRTRAQKADPWIKTSKPKSS